MKKLARFLFPILIVLLTGISPVNYLQSQEFPCDCPAGTDRNEDCTPDDCETDLQACCIAGVPVDNHLHVLILGGILLASFTIFGFKTVNSYKSLYFGVQKIPRKILHFFSNP